MIDIEKLLNQHGFEINCDVAVKDNFLSKYKTMLEAYHRAMCEVEASSTEATVLRPPLKRLDERRTLELWREAAKDKTSQTIPEKFANAIMDEIERINK